MKTDFFKAPVFYSVFKRLKKSTAFVNVKIFVFSFPWALTSCCPSVDIRIDRSKTVILGRQQLYAVLARSIA